MLHFCQLMLELANKEQVTEGGRQLDQGQVIQDQTGVDGLYEDILFDSHI